MSSDGKDAGSTWQGPAAPQAPHKPRNQAQEQQEFQQRVPELDDQEEFALSNRRREEEIHQARPDAIEATNVRASATDTSSRSAFAPTELLKQFRQYITLILVPLLFGALTCLFVLPPILAGRASLPPEGFLPILLVILAITIAQGVTIYYAGTDNGMRTLGTVGGFCLFLLVCCFALFKPIVGFILLIALIIIAVVLARRCLHSVPEGFVDIVFAAQKYRRTLYPGFNILLPWEKVSTRLNTQEVQWICPVQIVQLSRDDDVMLRAVISYQLLQEDAYLAVTQTRDWEEDLRNLFITTLQSIATVFRPKDFMPWPRSIHSQYTAQAGDDDFTGSFARRQEINTHLFQLVRDKVALWGVQINWVSIRDIELAPHGANAIHEQPDPIPTPAPEPQLEPTPTPTPKSQPEPAREIKQIPMVEAKAPPAGKTQPASSKAQATPKPAASTPKAAEQPAKSAASLPTNQLKEELLVQAYKTVQEGHVKDPETIRGIAAKFEMVAQDHEASQAMSFDAQRAALNLYEQARKYEEEYEKNTYSQDTQPDWIARRPTDENLMAGVLLNFSSSKLTYDIVELGCLFVLNLHGRFVNDAHINI